MGVFNDLIGTSKALFRLGLLGPHVKGEGAGDVSMRNTADSAYVAMRTSLVKVFGNDIQLNAGAAGSGVDWLMTLSRPTAGMANAIQIIMPSGNPAAGQALTVASYAAGVVTLEYTTVAAGTDKVVVDTTTLAFGSASPVTMFTKPANAVVRQVKVIIDTAFDGTPSASVGIAGTTSKYMPSTALDLTMAAKTVFEYDAGEPAVGSTEALIITYSAGGASAGSARVEVEYVIPS